MRVQGGWVTGPGWPPWVESRGRLSCHGGREWCQGGSGGAAPGFAQTLGDLESKSTEGPAENKCFGVFWEVQQVQGAHPVPSSCTRHKSLCSSEKESSGSNVEYTMEVLVSIQTCGSFQNPGWMVGWNSGRRGVVEETRAVGHTAISCPAPRLLWLGAKELGSSFPGQP